MSESIIVRIRLPVQSGTIRAKEIGDLIVASQDLFEPYFCRLVDPYDARYSIDSDSLEIDNIETDGTSGSVSGTVTSSFFAGCRDQNGSDQHDFYFEFDTVDGDLVFAIELPPQWAIGD